MPFKILRKDLTKMDVDAIVNPTNTKGFGAEGVDDRPLRHRKGQRGQRHRLCKNKRK